MIAFLNRTRLRLGKGDLAFVALAVLVAAWFYVAGVQERPGGRSGNDSYVAVWFYLLSFTLLNATIRRELVSALKDWRVLGTLVIAIALRTEGSLFCFAHINYHGPHYAWRLLHRNFAHEAIPFGFTSEVFWLPVSFLLPLAGERALFTANLLLNSLTGLILFLLVKGLFKREWVAWTTFALYCLSPLQIRYAASESRFNVVLFLEILFLWVAVLRRNTLDRSLDPFAVALLCFATFSRPEMFLGWIWLLAFYLLMNGLELGREWGRAAVLAGGAFLLGVPPAWLPLVTIGEFASSHPSGFAAQYFKVMPLYLLALAGPLLWIPRFLRGEDRPNSFLALWLCSFALPVLVLGNRHWDMQVGAYYLSYLEFVPLLGLALVALYVESFARSSWGTVIGVLLVVMATLQYGAKHDWVTKLYDEQLEYRFIDQVHEPSMGSVRILGPEVDPRLVHETSDELTYHLEHQMLPFRVRPAARASEVYFRPFTLGARSYDRILESLGFRPVEIRSFPFERRYRSLAEGNELTIGFYRKMSDE